MSADRPFRFSLILPCYNEMEHIRISIEKISRFLAFVFPSGDYEIILVDDGSTDGTRDFLSSLPASDRLQIILNQKNLGRGGAVKVGMRAAKGRTCGFIDIDLEVSESYIPKLLQLIEDGADIALGTRVYKIAFAPISFIRHILSSGYVRLSHLLLDIGAADSEAGYKFFSQKACEAILRQSRFENWFFDTECVLICQNEGMRIAEQPVLFLRNPGKTSTVRVFRDTLQYLSAIRQFKAHVRAGAYGTAIKKLH